jgi:hypothetical protein
LFLIVSFVHIEFEFIGAKMESINDGDVIVIVDHDLENEETQITDTPEKPTRKT